MQKKNTLPSMSLAHSSWGKAALTGSFVLAPLMFGLSACSSSDCGNSRDCFKETEQVPNGGQGGDVGENENEPGRESAHDQNLGGAGGTASGVEEKCIAEDSDKPDAQFIDTNCDGIDGDKLSAIFVNPLGSDTRSGSFDEPVQSISQAISLAQAAGKDVYVCTERYEEQLDIHETGVEIYGGYACDDWRRNDSRATVAPESGVPLRIELLNGLHVEQLNFEAQHAENKASSMAAVIKDAKEVSFVRVKLVAGRGSAGEAGTAGETHPASQNGADGQLPCDGHGCMGGLGGKSTTAKFCRSGVPSETGAFGGIGAYNIVVARPGDTATSGALGGAVSSSPSARNGQSGTSGAAGTLGIFSDTFLGHFEGDIYVASNSGGAGQRGINGNAGGGGAGGRLLEALRGSGGGQGGFGGCGGLGGAGGTAGGGSFALVSINSEISLSQSLLVTDLGGVGGNGGKGGAGAAGGLGGTSPAPSDTQRGGNGGKGGNGGAGGNGAPGGGGPSIAIALVSGTAPVLEDVSFELGNAGKGGVEPSGSQALSGLRTDAYDFVAGTKLTL